MESIPSSFQLSVTEPRNLRSLGLTANDLSSVPAEVLVRSIMSDLEEMSLINTILTPDQVSEIFIQMSIIEDHNFRTLKLMDDLSSAPPSTLRRSIMSG